MSLSSLSIFFFFNDTATTEIYTLSLHDALPISGSYMTVRELVEEVGRDAVRYFFLMRRGDSHLVFNVDLAKSQTRSEEHTSELQSQSNIVCRLLLEKKKKEEPQHLPH